MRYETERSARLDYICNRLKKKSLAWSAVTKKVLFLWYYFYISNSSCANAMFLEYYIKEMFLKGNIYLISVLHFKTFHNDLCSCSFEPIFEIDACLFEIE